ncbi:hypothetical protein V8E36_000848 [Tilletia maclaganii]
MDIYTRYNLPPPPPPTLFSRSDSVNRARLPNFTSVDQVSAFIDNAIVWRHSAPVDRFFVFSLVFKLVLELTLFGFILHKIGKRSWWVIRIARRGHSIRLVPNVHSCWALLMGSFGLLTVGFFGVSHYSTVANKPAQNIALWMTLMWSPMAFAVWYQTWGIFATWQDASEPPMVTLPAWVPPLLVDFFYVCLPGIPSIAALIPGILANRSYEQARLDRYTWQTNFAGQNYLSRQKIFTSSMKGTYYQCLALIIWFIACLGFVAAYGIASLGLVSDLRQLVSKHSDKPIVVSSPWERKEGSESSNARPFTLQTVGSGDLSGDSSPQYMRTTKTSESSCDSDKIEGHLFSVAEVEDDRSKTFFPPIAPSLTVTELKRSHARKVLLWFALQSISVTLGGLALAAVILYALICFYPAAEQNRPEVVQARAYIVVCVIMIIFCLTTAVSITHATFEASFAALMAARRRVGRATFRA